ncbi:g-patch domain-containing protein [Zymoseptoria brevis]|uniref:G-patch domain-containing protein n=1 Tax=Zymoseptoria brevis TaxID=1047168 RepID=A0A0F4GMV6_9PEZI|nr:g-patch domain-containing protein [Zymoseptoria brevis]
MASADDDDDEDDYLSMTFDTLPNTKVKESSIQRIARQKREAAERGNILPKAEREALDRAKLESALTTELDTANPSNKGALLMAKMGFKKGEALGKMEGARTRPIEVEMREGRGGIGLEGERKRKIRELAEEVEGGEKKVKLTAEEFRERNRVEVEERRVEGMVWGAMKVLEGIVGGGEDREGDAGVKEKPLKSVNVLYRPLVKQRLERERERRMRYDMDQSLSRSRRYEEEEEDEKLAYGDEVEEDLEEEDTELEAFEALDAKEKLEKLVGYLREQHHYCFWCKFKYEDAEMEGCPGLSEDEHG